jgi:hypothetical protein
MRPSTRREFAFGTNPRSPAVGYFDADVLSPALVVADDSDIHSHSDSLLNDVSALISNASS